MMRGAPLCDKSAFAADGSGVTNMATLLERFWRSVTVLVRIDMIAAIVLATGLFLWLTWR